MSNYNYYETLEIPRTCSQEDIADAYRRLSLKYHPKNPSATNSPIYEHKFHALAEAYQVLSDPNKKSIYDIYGKDGLYNGILSSQHNLKGGYKYAGNAYEIFEQFMGSENPFAVHRDYDTMKGEHGSAFSNAYGGQQKKKESQLKNVEVDMKCSLRELYGGTIKEIEYERAVLNADKRTTSMQMCKVKVEVFPGYGNGSVVTLKEMGNEAPGKRNSDLVVKIVQERDKEFIREGDDLVYVKKVKLVEALNSVPVKVNTLDNRKLAITIDEIISPQTVKIVKGEGMPIYGKDTKQRKGDLIIRFDIVFPEYIQPHKKEQIVSLLQS